MGTKNVQENNRQRALNGGIISFVVTQAIVTNSALISSVCTVDFYFSHVPRLTSFHEVIIL